MTILDWQTVIREDRVQIHSFLHRQTWADSHRQFIIRLYFELGSNLFETVKTSKLYTDLLFTYLLFTGNLVAMS